ncbi:MAG: hypothetical protein ABEK12_00485 [Candidatus Nanohaloarchaea archaeon]
MTLDTAALIDAGKMQPDCSDIRVYEEAAAVPFNVVGCNTDSTVIRFAADVAARTVDDSIFLYYGSKDAAGREQAVPGGGNGNAAAHRAEVSTTVGSPVRRP